MLNKKEQYKRGSAEWHLHLFDEYMEDHEDYKFYSGLYSKIRNSYYGKIKSGTIDISVERIRLEEKLNKRSCFFRKNKEYSGRRLVYKLAHEALEGIERELQDEKIKQKEQLEKLERESRMEQYAGRGSVVERVILPAALELASSVVRKENPVKNLFKKLKGDRHR